MRARVGPLPACGQYAVVKMKLFARVLCLEGFDQLATDATDAYQRLVVKLGEPKAEEDAEEGDGDQD